MKLTKKQKLQLQDKGYEPCVRHLNLYPEDFYKLKTWVEVRECLGIDDGDEVVLSLSGVKTNIFLVEYASQQLTPTSFLPVHIIYV